MSTPSEPETKQPGLPGLPPIDVNEYGGKKDGERQAMNRRLFMQLLVFDAPAGEAADEIGKDVEAQLRRNAVAGVVYADASNPRGLGLLTWSEDPAHFVQAVRPLFTAGLAAQGGPAAAVHDAGPHLRHGPRAGPRLRPPAPRHPQRDEDGVPVARLVPAAPHGRVRAARPPRAGPILREHAQIGMAYGRPELAHDVRLACHGLDAEDNEFVIGLVGRELHPLSHLVQAMRKTRQTSEFIAKMGPFFVGYVLHRHG